MFYTIIFALIALCFLTLWVREQDKHKRTRRTSSRLIHKQALEINGWKQGIEETADSYEQQFLSLNEEIEITHNRSEHWRLTAMNLAAEVYLHRLTCLPILNFDERLEEVKAMEEDDLWAEVITGQ